MSWGFTTNCPKYLVETSRGHKDERHQEPIVLRNAGAQGDVVFMPPNNAFSIDISGLTNRVKQLPIFDVEGRKVVTLVVSKDGKARNDFRADNSRKGKLWRLHLNDAQAVMRIFRCGRRIYPPGSASMKTAGF
jgi:hypothetical protein